MCSNGTVTPEECPEGYYCEEGKLPQPCPEGTYRDKKSGINITYCSDCPAGRFCQGVGNIVPTGNPGIYSIMNEQV